WSERYDGDIGDAFALQETIAAKAADALALAFGELRRARGASLNAASFDAYARARQLLRHGGVDSVADAAKGFERVVRSAPDFARAWSGLASARVEMLRTSRAEQAWLGEEAREAAERAIGLDAAIAEPYAVLAALE